MVDLASWRAAQTAELVASGECAPPSLSAPFPSSPSSFDTDGMFRDLMASASRLPAAPLFQFLVWALQKLSDIPRTWTAEDAAEMARRKVF